MKFVLATDKAANLFVLLKQLRENYEKKKGVDFAKPETAGRLPTVLGGTDLKTRDQQLQFLEKTLVMLAPLTVGNEDDPVVQKQHYLMAYQIAVAACLFILSQTEPGVLKRMFAKGSQLALIIKETLSMTSTNYLDDEDKKTCYICAHRFMQQLDLAKTNSELEKHSMNQFTQDEWYSFSTFLKEQITAIKTNEQGSSYPIAISVSVFLAY